MVENMSLEFQENISSFVDDELNGCDELLDQLGEDLELQARYGRYCLISDAIKRNLPERPNHDLLNRVQTALQSEPALLAPVAKQTKNDSPEAEVMALPKRHHIKPAFTWGIAASVMLVAVSSFQMFRVNNDFPQATTIAASQPVETQSVIAKQSSTPTTAMTFVADELPPPDASSTTFAEQSLIDDGQWTRITRVGDIPLGNNIIFKGSDNYVPYEFQPKMLPLARSVKLDNSTSK